MLQLLIIISLAEVSLDAYHTDTMTDLTKRAGRKKSKMFIAGLVLLAATVLVGWLYFPAAPKTVIKPNLKPELLVGQSLEAHLEYARDQATQRNLPVTICASDNGQSCSGEKAWDSGWIIFTDTTGSPGQFNPGDGLLFAGVGGPKRSSLTLDAYYVRYLSDGKIELE